MFFSLLFAILLSPAVFGAKSQSLCPEVILQDGEFELTNNEVVIVCGTEDGPSGWKKVPLAQAELALRNIFLNRGYLQPKFQRHENRLLVWKGTQTQIRSLTVNGTKGLVNPVNKRKVLNHALTSDKLDEVQDWATFEIKTRGFACLEPEIEAHAWNGNLVVSAELGAPKFYAPLILDDLGGLDPMLLRRFQPFDAGELYDVREVQLMTNRMLDEGVFQSAYFITECKENIVQLSLKTSIGEPQTIRIGVGASTEEFPFLDVSYRHSRLDKKASSVTANFHASPRLISFKLGSQLYLFTNWYRSFLGPRAYLAREMERAFTVERATIGMDLGKKWDQWDVRFIGRIGPTLNYIRTIEGIGPDDLFFPSLEASLFLMSEVYEYWIRQQEGGWTFEFQYKGQKEGLGSEVDANRYDLEYRYLWNVRNYSPPFFVLASRFKAATVDAIGVTVSDRERLPISERIFFGGDDNLRGFARQSLDNGGLGYLTALYLGFELRLLHELPYRLQPFLLFDYAKLGNRKFTVEPPIYTSRGLGLRWMSPFGTLRATAAQGYIKNASRSAEKNEEGWVYFLSFGQEF